MDYSKFLYKQVINKLEKINIDKSLDKTAKIFALAYINKKNIYALGSGHSHILGEEFYVRSGGWNYIKPMLTDELTMTSNPWKSTYVERVANYADVLLAMFPLKKGDVILITSNSGRNGLIVEMALRAKKIGASVIAVTSIQHSNNVDSRHNSKKLLKDIADIVIDNQSDYGDTIVSIQNEKCASTSTLINVYIAQQIIIKTFTIFENKKIKFSTFLSSNVDQQDERNEKLL